MTKPKRDPFEFPFGPESAPPPMFAEVQDIHCAVTFGGEQKRCAHHKKPPKNHCGKYCAWQGDCGTCTNPIAIVQALHAALAKATKGDKHGND